MQLKEYQAKVMEDFGAYLTELDLSYTKYLGYKTSDPEIAEDYGYDTKAWKKISKAIYKPVLNGLSEPTPSVCLKIPTGGGKTILAAHCIDEIQNKYIKCRNGVVLWIAPSTQIYNQTFKALNDRNHPYRQVLDRSSAGRTVILTKKDRLNKQDTEEKLVVILLMLQSGNRENKDTLKMFQMSGGYDGFFPAEDSREQNNEVILQYPNLDTIGDDNDFYGKIVVQSFGNCLRLLKPIIILDEGHKTYSAKARDTILGFNPRFILELSATPTDQSNILVHIQGRDLERENMIKLPIHVDNRAETDWRLVVSEAKRKRDGLEKEADKVYQNSSTYIRPIQLIQVERTGKDQRENGYIHSEDVKEYLISSCSVPSEYIAIKSSDKDDIEGIDLLSKECAIRYIITKSALQEGWDCSFAYILTVLAGGKSTTAMTQLIGRVLRQPFAIKTGVPALDECYVVTYRQSTNELVNAIKNGLESEGLGDILKSVSINDDSAVLNDVKERSINIREEFKDFAGRVILPKFIIKTEYGSDDLNYERDIASKINWNKIKLDFAKDIALSNVSNSTTIVVDFSKERGEDFVSTKKDIITNNTNQEIDYLFVTRSISSIISNQWIAYNIAKECIQKLKTNYTEIQIANDITHVIHELQIELSRQIDKECQKIFKDLLNRDEVRFMIIENTGSFRIPSTIKTSGRAMHTPDSTKLVQYSLFDGIGEDDVNGYEKNVAMYFEKQERMLWWHRNLVGRYGYNVQGWAKKKIYADFVFTTKKSTGGMNKVYVLETKGNHIIGNSDTIYKQNLFDICNEIGVKKDWRAILENFEDHKIEFQLLSEDNWENTLNSVMKI
jgi:type III restriction enzyme